MSAFALTRQMGCSIMQGMSTSDHQDSKLPAGEDAATWYARRPWVVHYPDSMPRDVDIEAGATMLSLLQAACREHADGIGSSSSASRNSRSLSWCLRKKVSDHLSCAARGSS